MYHEDNVAMYQPEKENLQIRESQGNMHQPLSYKLHVYFETPITGERNMILKQNLHQLISLTKAQKALAVHSCKPWVTNLSIVPHMLGILTTTVICCSIFTMNYSWVSSDHAPVLQNQRGSKLHCTKLFVVPNRWNTHNTKNKVYFAL